MSLTPETIPSVSRSGCERMRDSADAHAPPHPQPTAHDVSSRSGIARLGQGVLVPHRAGGVGDPRAMRAARDLGRESQEPRYTIPRSLDRSGARKPSLLTRPAFRPVPA